MDIERCFEQQRRQDHSEDQIVGQVGFAFDPGRGNGDAGQHEPDGIGKPDAAGQHRNDDRRNQQFDCIGQDDIHRSAQARGAPRARIPTRISPSL